jgi:hypothetical protein
MRIALFAMVVSMCLVARAPAGPPAHRGGLFIGVGMGFGNASWEWADTSNYGTSPDEWAGTINIQLGGALRDDLVLGATFQGWSRKWIVESPAGVQLGEAAVQMGSITLGATWWPGNVGPYVRAGIGMGRGKIELTNGILVANSGSDTGPALLGAAGYEWRAAGAFAVGAQVEYVYLGLDGDAFQSAAVLDGSIQFSWYW